MRQGAAGSRADLQSDAATLTDEHRQRFHALYREHFDFVYRNLRRLGVAQPAIDDALQDVYLVVLRRLGEFRTGTHERAWLFAITMRVASNHRRTQRRRGDPQPLDAAPLAAADASPFEAAAQAEARRVLHAFLERLDDNRRAVFVMSELEQLTAVEIAQALPANLNTVYSWLRSARIEFARMLEKGGPGSRG